MDKTYAKCKLCYVERFPNNVGLCKRCNQKKEGIEIVKKIMKKQKEILEAQGDIKEQKRQEEIERQALESRENLTTEQKERLVELTPSVKTVEELEKKLAAKEKEEEKPEEEKKE